MKMSTQETDGSPISTDVRTTENARADRSDETVVATRGLDVYYNDDQALDDIDIEIPENKVTALIGPSGWEIDVPPVYQPDERPDRRRPRRG